MTPRAAPPVATLILALAFAASVQGQSESDGGLTPGDVVRVDREFVGTLLSIEGRSTLTVIGEGKQRCYAGQAPGEKPRCDPAPSIRRVVDWNGTTVERQLSEFRNTRRIILGALIGGGVMAPIGYVTGPSLGYGRIDGCSASPSNGFCEDPIPDEVLERRQRSRDQLRGSLLFGIVGATMGALVARSTVDEWIEVRPPSAVGDGAWSLSMRLPPRGR